MEKIFDLIINNNYFPKGENVEKPDEKVIRYTIKNVNRNQRYEIKKIIKSEIHKDNLFSRTHIETYESTSNRKTYFLEIATEDYILCLQITMKETDYKKFDIKIQIDNEFYDDFVNYRMYINTLKEKQKLQEALINKEEVNLSSGRRKRL